jgi:hypothetical protein
MDKVQWNEAGSLANTANLSTPLRLSGQIHEKPGAPSAVQDGESTGLHRRADCVEVKNDDKP